ncbi:MAG: hypothetical protein K5930_11605 [Treponemataceae bacterium]|nr:hypothetical protein [Treponemataceae bacterium]
MSDNQLRSSRPKAVYEPGELEKTRRNLGILDADEAQELMRKLGGEIGVEKSASFDESKMPSRTRTYVSRRASSGSSSSSSVSSSSSSGYSSDSSSSKSYSSATSYEKKKNASRDVLPNLSSKIRQAMDEILVMNRIKPKLGFFSQLINRAFNRGDRVTEEFLTDQLAVHMKNIHTFYESVARLVDRTNDDYKSKIQQDKSTYFQTLKVITTWDEKPLLTEYQKIRASNLDVTVQKLIPIVREIYAFLYRLYFLGAERVSQYIKRLVADIAKQQNMSESEQMQSIERNASSSWIYLHEHCMKGLYPLLMRMCCSDLVLYPDMMKSESSNILSFIGMTKYDVVFPDKDDDVIAQSQAETENKSEKDEVLRAREKKYKDQIVQGINILDIMFPSSGWREINKLPDMFAYFHGLYKFKEGLNYLSPENPLLITMILLRISEDFLSGCRNVNFQLDGELRSIIEGQNLQEFMDSWAEYREVLFDRNYMSFMRDYVNNMYANLDYAKTQFGRRNMSNLQWYAHNQFLPLLKFELKFLDKQEADHILPPLYRQVSMLRELFAEIIERAENALQTEGEEAYKDEALGVLNLWGPYVFALSTPVSKRLDVLLGGKQSKQANNLNLLKYTSAVLAVLDWWINNKASPAYTVSDPENVYRHDEEGVPIFSVKPMDNVNDFFSENIKRTMGKK